MTICKILEGILPKETVRGAPPPDKKLLEYQFVFACVWAFGGSMLVDKVSHEILGKCKAHLCSIIWFHQPIYLDASLILSCSIKTGVIIQTEVARNVQ
jgi:hypothetical protein